MKCRWCDREFGGCPYHPVKVRRKRVKKEEELPLHVHHRGGPAKGKEVVLEVGPAVNGYLKGSVQNPGIAAGLGAVKKKSVATGRQHLPGMTSGGKRRKRRKK